MNSPQIKMVSQMTYIQLEFERFMRERMSERGLEITRVRFGILHQIKQTGKLHQQALADWNNISTQALHRHIRILESRGYIEKSTDSNDARISALALTDSGRKLISDSEKVLTRAVKEFLSPLSEEEVQTVTMLLSKIKTFRSEFNHT